MSFNSSVFGVESGICQGWEAGGNWQMRYSKKQVREN